MRVTVYYQGHRWMFHTVWLPCGHRRTVTWIDGHAVSKRDH